MQDTSNAFSQIYRAISPMVKWSAISSACFSMSRNVSMLCAYSPFICCSISSLVKSRWFKSILRVSLPPKYGFTLASNAAIWLAFAYQFLINSSYPSILPDFKLCITSPVISTCSTKRFRSCLVTAIGRYFANTSVISSAVCTARSPRSCTSGVSAPC